MMSSKFCHLKANKIFCRVLDECSKVFFEVLLFMLHFPKARAGQAGGAGAGLRYPGNLT